MHAAQCVAAMLALAARFGEPLRLTALAEQQLAEPKGEALFANAAGAREEETRWQATVVPRAREPRPERELSVEGAMCHAVNIQPAARDFAYVGCLWNAFAAQS